MDVVSKVFKQTSYQILGKIATSVSTLLVLYIISHNFSKSEIGIFTLAQTYIAFFYLAVDLGLNGYFLPKLDQASHSLNQLFNFRLFFSIPLIVLAILLQSFLGYKNLDFFYSVCILSLSILFNSLFISASLVFQRRLRYDLSSLALAANSLIIISLAYLFAKFNLPVYFLALASLAGWIGASLVSIVSIRQLSRLKLAWPRFNFMRQEIWPAWPIALTLLLNVFYFRVDAFVLAHYRSFSETGIYNVAYQIFQSVLVLPTFVLNSYYPMMADLFKLNFKQFLSQFKMAVLILFLIGCGGNILAVYLAPWFITLVTSAQFKDSILPLQILSASFPAFFVSGLLMWALVLMNKYKIMLAIYAGAALVNLSLNLTFIPHYSYIAAAIVTVFSEYLILILEVIIVTRSLVKLKTK